MNIVYLVIGYLLAKIRYINKADPFEKFSKLKSDCNHKIVDKRCSILVLPIRVTPMSNTFEGVMAYLLQKMGHEVNVLMGGMYLKYNENINISKNKLLHSCLSYYEQYRFIKTYECESLWIEKNVNDAKLMELIKLFDFENIINIKINGINIGKHALHGTMRYLMVETIRIEHENILREFFITALKVYLALENILSKKRFDRALISHGCYSTWGVALDVLKKHSIHTVVWGRGYVGNGDLLFAKNDSYLYEYIDEKIEFEKINLTDFDETYIKDYYRKKRSPLNTVDGLSYYGNTHYKVNNEEIIKLQQLNKKFKKTIGIYPNIPWDGTMFSGTDATPNMRNFIKTIIQVIVEFKDILFIIRTHPAEFSRTSDLTKERFIDIFEEEKNNKLFENLIVFEADSTVTSYDVDDNSDAAIVFASTMSLELAVNEKIVFQFGKTNTSNKNIVIECNTFSDIRNKLIMLKNNELALSDEQKTNAVKYAYHWIKRKHHIDPFIKVQAHHFVDFKFKKHDELYTNSNLNFVKNLLEL